MTRMLCFIVRLRSASRARPIARLARNHHVATSRPVRIAAASSPCCWALRQYAAQVVVPDGARANVAILETTDMHANVLSYDYYKLGR